jgi:lipid-binding SYLF domain-containing protein
MRRILGAELTDFVLVLNTKEAVKTFSQGGNITLGANVSGKMWRKIIESRDSFGAK